MAVDNYGVYTALIVYDMMTEYSFPCIIPVVNVVFVHGVIFFLLIIPEHVIGQLVRLDDKLFLHLGYNVKVHRTQLFKKFTHWSHLHLLAVYLNLYINIDIFYLVNQKCILLWCGFVTV